MLAGEVLEGTRSATRFSVAVDRWRVSCSGGDVVGAVGASGVRSIPRVLEKAAARERTLAAREAAARERP